MIETLLFRLTDQEQGLFNDWRKNHDCPYLVKNLKQILSEEEKKKYEIDKYYDERSLYIEGGEFRYVFALNGLRGVSCPCGSSYTLPSRRDLAEGKGTPLCGCD